MSEFILNRDFNGSLKGETVSVPNHLDGQMIRNRIGQRVITNEKEDAIDIRTKSEPGKDKINTKSINKAPKNKMIGKSPKNK